MLKEILGYVSDFAKLFGNTFVYGLLTILGIALLGFSINLIADIVCFGCNKLKNKIKKLFNKNKEVDKKED